MRCDAPPTPDFSAELERRLREAAAHGSRPRFPTRLTALRSLRGLNQAALHVALACGFAAIAFLLSSPTARHPAPLTPDLEASLTPAYLHQYGARDVEETIEAARERGYEVQMVTWYVPDRSDHQRILSISHAGTEIGHLPEHDETRGPLLVVVGFAVGDRSSTAD